MINKKEYSRDIQKFIEDYSKSLRNGNAAIFAGAGLSIPSGAMGWPDLLKDVAENLGLSNDKYVDLITLAQYYVNQEDSRTELSELIMESFSPRAGLEINETQKILSKLPIDTIWTTNYDNLIEKAFKLEYKNVLVKKSPEDFSLNSSRYKTDVILYKMHGDKDTPEKAIITKDDYETYNDTHLVYTTALKGDLVEKKFLFIGFSFEDPNLEYILARIRSLIGQNKPKHYFFIEKVIRKENESVESFELRKTKQKLKIKDLKRYRIYAVEINSYNKDIPNILQIIKSKVNMNNIFISGASIEENEKKCSDLVNTIVPRLIDDSKNKIISGYGLGIGSLIINNVLDKVTENRWLKFDDTLKLYPFPQGEYSAKNWTIYRKKMIADAGIAIFIFGTKKDKNGVEVESKGMLEEFEIAHELGCKIVPVGCSGGVSKKIYETMKSNINEYHGNQRVIEMIDKLDQCEISDNEIIGNLIESIILELKK
ncbi:MULTISPECIES: SIR2 family protein [Vagococcus]|uniref:NAD(+) hydrolase ThsA n=1 Tax=Vagococcus fluvialis bH819 TaxID=1255619 RepID=A0A1X6WLF5_9ENTE|nr:MULTISPECIES: SIR2 family protein [Vagococcus]SLM85154.1 USG protein [Vagococcus fluvialis bH819]HCM88433.1 hypothetical protein [Vagococcus sp.]